MHFTTLFFTFAAAFYLIRVFIVYWIDIIGKIGTLKRYKLDESLLFCIFDPK